MQRTSSEFIQTAVKLLPSMVKEIDQLIAKHGGDAEGTRRYDPPNIGANVCEYLKRNEKAKQVLAVCSMIPKGKVTSYGVIGQVLELYEGTCEGDSKTAPAKAARKSASAPAKSLGSGNGSRYSRFVGSALHRNPFAPYVPCHRVVAHDGKLNGFAGGLCKKREMLVKEGVALHIRGKDGSELKDETCFVPSSSFV